MSRRTHLSLAAPGALLVLALMAAAMPVTALGKTDVKACQKDGYRNYTDTSGQRFATQADCSAYVRKGNALSFDLLEVTPQPANEGDVVVGNTNPAPVSVTLTNVGSISAQSLQVGGVESDPLHSFNFDLANVDVGGCFELAPGQSCVWTVALSPTDAGPAAARIIAVYSAPDGRSGTEFIDVTANGVAPPPS